VSVRECAADLVEIGAEHVRTGQFSLGDVQLDRRCQCLDGPVRMRLFAGVPRGHSAFNQ
jgi:hypothetical protein